MQCANGYRIAQSHIQSSEENKVLTFLRFCGGRRKGGGLEGGPCLLLDFIFYSNQKGTNLLGDCELY